MKTLRTFNSPVSEGDFRKSMELCKALLERTVRADSQGSSATREYLSTDYKPKPPIGSRLHRILCYARYSTVVLKVIVSLFASKHSEGTDLALRCFEILLELAHAHAYVEAVEQAFYTFDETARKLDLYYKHRELLKQTQDWQCGLRRILANWVNLVVRSTIHYKKNIKPMTPLVDFNTRFHSRLKALDESMLDFVKTMWDHQISAAKCSEIAAEDDVRGFSEIRDWLLSPWDRDPDILQKQRHPIRARRAEFSCEWAAKDVSDFLTSGDTTFTIMGDSQTGKSVLAGWMVDMLKLSNRSTSYRSKSYQVVHVVIDPFLRRAPYPIELLKRLIFGLLDHNIGNMELYSHLSKLAKLDEDEAPEHGNAECECCSYTECLTSLLDGVNLALKSVHYTIVFVVDSLDNFKGDVSQLCKLLWGIAKSNQNARVIVFSRPTPKPLPQSDRHLTIDRERTSEVVKHMVRDSFTRRGFHEDHRVESAAKLVAQRSQGSLPCTEIMLQCLPPGNLVDDPCVHIEKLPGDTNGLLDEVVKSLPSPGLCILPWLHCYGGPIPLPDIKGFLGVKTRLNDYTWSFTTLDDMVRDQCLSLIFTQDNHVWFLNEAVIMYMMHSVNNIATVREFNQDYWLGAGYIRVKRERERER